MIGYIITNVLIYQSTDLHISLGILMINSKIIINHIHGYRVKCSYDDGFRFMKSVATAKAADPKFQGILISDIGLVQHSG